MTHLKFVKNLHLDFFQLVEHQNMFVFFFGDLVIASTCKAFAKGCGQHVD